MATSTATPRRASVPETSRIELDHQDRGGDGPCKVLFVEDIPAHDLVATIDAGGVVRVFHSWTGTLQRTLRGATAWRRTDGLSALGGDVIMASGAFESPSAEPEPKVRYGFRVWNVVSGEFVTEYSSRWESGRYGDRNFTTHCHVRTRVVDSGRFVANFSPYESPWVFFLHSSGRDMRESHHFVAPQGRHAHQFASNGECIATVRGDTLTLWNAETSEEIRSVSDAVRLENTTSVVLNASHVLAQQHYRHDEFEVEMHENHPDHVTRVTVYDIKSLKRCWETDFSRGWCSRFHRGPVKWVGLLGSNDSTLSVVMQNRDITIQGFMRHSHGGPDIRVEDSLGESGLEIEDCALLVNDKLRLAMVGTVRSPRSSSSWKEFGRDVTAACCIYSLPFSCPPMSAARKEAIIKMAGATTRSYCLPSTPPPPSSGLAGSSC